MRGLVPAWSVVACVVLIVAGMVLILVSASDTADLAGFVVFGLGAVGGTGLAFYAVGRSEDIERERTSSGR